MLLPSLMLVPAPFAPLAHRPLAGWGAPRCAAEFGDPEWLPDPEFDKQTLEQEFAAASFRRPATTEELRKYLLGSWRLRKATTYNSGGISGRFDGRGSFADFSHPTRALVCYSEEGIFQPTVDQLPSSETLETRNQLMYDFSDPGGRVDVFYDDPSQADRSPEAVVSNLRFLHSLHVGTLVLTEHADGPDTYTGKLDIEAPHAFLTTWAVTGASTAGQIVSMYTRTGWPRSDA
tara:strand:+ start:600 stop:1298 length:699 start_codon:yes stop_codon:yes gene_type:complete